MTRPRLLVLLAVLLTCSTVIAGGSWDRYVRRPIAQVVEANLEAFESSGVDLYFSASDFATRSTAVYLGEIRAMSDSRLDFVDRYWGKMRGRPDVAALFQNEILCQEGDNEYWLPMQQSVLEYLKREATTGSNIELFVIWAGVINLEEQADWVFLANEFVVLKASDAG